ncbi:MAG TPA: lytic transglycosylase domain-containing protein [Caulobacteraceae bacterium]
MASRLRTTPLLAGAVVLAAGLAAAQPLSPGTTIPPSSPTYGAYGGYGSSGQSYGSSTQSLTDVLLAAKAGDGSRLRSAMASLYDPTSRKIALWALADAAPNSMTFLEADTARRQLAGWPRPVRRQMAAENALETSGLSPREVVAWFAGAQPVTARGAMALASALQATGQAAAAAELIRRTWRSEIFDEDTQEVMLARFGAVLRPADHVAREDLLLYGAQGTAAEDMLRLLPPDQQALARARMAVRRGSPQAPSLIDALPYDLRRSPGLAFEQVSAFQSRGDTGAALSIVGNLPDENPLSSAAEHLWKHGALVSAALKVGNQSAAYAAAAHSGLVSGADAAEAEFDAGWIALTRLRNPQLADKHFEKLLATGTSPLTQSRALYWRGRVAETLGDQVGAQLYYGQAARYTTTFYGQLASTKGGAAVLTLGRDPLISGADRARFEAMDAIKAARLLAAIGAKDTFKGFVAGLSELLPTAADEAMLVDLARGLGDQEISMRVVRNAAKRNLILPERGYPVHSMPRTYGGPEAPFVLGIMRQESGFDSHARSGAGARGMMQLMPATAAAIARRLGMEYAAGDLEDPDYNMRLGTAYLGQLVDEFSGSYVMASAAYNAGPGRPNEWSVTCGDPRSSSVNPVDFIECIPFSQTRDYVMRVLEATQVYRARLNGGSAAITLASDLKRGSYGYSRLTVPDRATASLGRPSAP